MSLRIVIPLKGLAKARPVKGYTRIVNGKMQQIAPHMDPRDAARAKQAAGRKPVRDRQVSSPKTKEPKDNWQSLVDVHRGSMGAAGGYQYSPQQAESEAIVSVLSHYSHKKEVTDAIQEAYKTGKPIKRIAGVDINWKTLDTALTKLENDKQAQFDLGDLVSKWWKMPTGVQEKTNDIKWELTPKGWKNKDNFGNLAGLHGEFDAITQVLGNFSSEKEAGAFRDWMKEADAVFKTPKSGKLVNWKTMDSALQALKGKPQARKFLTEHHSDTWNRKSK